MDKNEVKNILDQEIKQLNDFVNYHGITLENLRCFLVEPFEISVDSDDSETSPRYMWVVLQEYKDVKRGYSIVFDPYNNDWGISEHISNDEYVLVIGAETLKDALEGM
jgi:hypothetical protein